MDKDFERLIKVNIQGRVFVTCQSHGVTDPVIIGFYVEILEQAIGALLTDQSTTADFQQILEDQLGWLERELKQAGGKDSAAAPPAESKPAEAGGGESPQKLKEEKHAFGSVPEAKSMPERLKEQRSILESLLDNDCITLKLVTPDEANAYKHGLLGKEPEKAEEELVTALRNVLYTQVRKFIRKHNGGPWASASQQHDLRLEITKTRHLHSLITLARELLSEREAWLKKTKGGLTGRFFGGRFKVNE